MRESRRAPPQPQYTDAELLAMQAETNYRNCRAMMLHYARLAHAWRHAALRMRPERERYFTELESDFYDIRTSPPLAS